MPYHGRRVRVAVITAGSRGVGAALVAGYVRLGWAVVVSVGPAEPSGDSQLLTVAGDVCEPATAERVLGAALERFGRVDTLVNNAGEVPAKPFTEYTAADYATAAGVGLGGFFGLTRCVVADMARRYGGHVVTVSPVPARVRQHSAPAVLAAMTGGALVAATGALAAEYAAHGIRANVVSAGSISEVVAGVLFFEASPGITGALLDAGAGRITQIG
ncbi:SDR family NAD(P)-dependent oxidoreductase [Actinoplanes sp. NPDC048967]|uniref:SDR family NAD(P)-dependent oxidoreductase n=1 Tax=Actinoplanes sp. NPDC048967 TaxID=3155269 RepID=UPI0033C1910D